MTIHTLVREQEIPAPPEEIFAFFSKPENLAVITPPDLGFRILTPPPIPMREGALIDYTIRLAGIPVRWTTLITACDHGRSFVDEQLRGPYASWRHLHEFRPAPGGGTMMRDEVRYALPLGILGGIVHALAVKGRLKKIFDYRADAIARRFARDGVPA